MRMKAVAFFLGIGISMGMIFGSGHTEDAFDALCKVLQAAERVLNKTGQHSGPLREALYGKSGGVLRVEKGQVTVKGRCNNQVNRGLVCTYRSGGYGYLAETFPGAILCLCTPGSGRGVNTLCGFGASQPRDIWSGGGTTIEHKNSLFQNFWDNVIKKCHYKKWNEWVTHGDEVSALETAVERARDALKQGPRGKNNFFYLGEQVGFNGCTGINPRNGCVAYHQGRGEDKHTVHILWADAIKEAISDLKKAWKPKAAQASSVPATLTSSDSTPNEPESFYPHEPSDTSNPTNTTEEWHNEERHPTETASPAHQSRPTSRTRRSTTERPTATGTAPDDTSTSDEPEILDPTAAPFPLGDGTNILAPLGLFMAASSFSKKHDLPPSLSVSMSPFPLSAHYISFHIFSLSLVS
ncbi:Variant surface glycoprotein [Trypanosoma congolense IL3000]|uniref:Variant surface glycoprotein n=1 Tax=Trypanosoma congolense (strain IL3000) TaxID=1068625 RepID=F9WH14_TRYCI|nr:Variant surface glycoprotein [Trypanosoma congolense IL3000]